ncbi:MAG TPA: MotA/TolQ/ExbB proton channel family protein [Opitutaceae bacterium]|nr:MotA/TolQ/ExbB proton channel family protein [Opitutaceae bacterium]
MQPRVLFLLTVAGFGLTALRAQTPASAPDEVMRNAAADYRERISRAAGELNRARTRIGAEKAPLLEQMRAAQDRVIVAESEATRLETRAEDVTEQRRKLLLELDALRKTTSYVSTLAHDGLKAAADGLAPGEDQFAGERLQALQKQIDDATAGPRSSTALDAADFLLARTERAVGGYRADGRAMIGETNEVLPGTFAFVGPETFFRPKQGGAPGAVRPREGAKYPVSYSLANWRAQDADPFFAGQPGTIAADASGGKALRLKETTGTVWEHIRKGGLVAFGIVGVGALAVLMIFQKIRDLRQMAVDAPATVEACLKLVAAGSLAEAEKVVNQLKRTTRELFLVGLRHADQPANILEERLQAVLLEQRLHYERRLPLLAVIATAAPLMGLLGTVVGMVKTFALITVFGTGNAGKLSSGISEVLVATELGLVVAIPTLVAHGFLAHRIQRNLSALERYALQFTTAVGTAKAAWGNEPKRETIPA